MQKNYEQLKQYLHSEKAKPEKQILKSRELSMHTDENNIVTSYPNKDVQEERFVIRPKYRNIRIPRHRHEYIELSFILDGEISMEIDGTPIKMSSGDICLMNKNVIHSSEKIGDDIWMFNILMTADFFDTIFMYLLSEDNYISNYIINSLYSESKKKNYILYHLPKNSFESTLMEQILCEYFLEKPRNQGKILSCLLILFIEISRAVGPEDQKAIKQKHSKIQNEVFDYLKQHYKDTTLQSVAKHMCFHPNYLSSLLKAETGRGFKDILIDIRMTEAANLLRNTNRKIEEITSDIGYANETYFYKCFRQKYGISPYNYRKAQKNLKKEQ